VKLCDGKKSIYRGPRRARGEVHWAETVRDRFSEPPQPSTEIQIILRYYATDDRGYALKSALGERQSTDTRRVFRLKEGKWVRAQEVRRCTMPGGLGLQSGTYTTASFQRWSTRGLLGRNFLFFPLYTQVRRTRRSSIPFCRLKPDSDTLDFQWQKEMCLVKTQGAQNQHFL
jgi:hypothetical protein